MNSVTELIESDEGLNGFATLGRDPLPWAGYGSRLFGAGECGWNRLAVARRPERRGTRSQAVWEPTRQSQSGAAAAATRLENHS